MRRFLKRAALWGMGLWAVCGVVVSAAGPGGTADADVPVATKAQKAMQAGNWKEAYDLYAKLATDPATNAPRSGQYLQFAIQCLGNLGRVEEMDAFCEKAITAHTAHWEVLLAAAQSYSHGEHYGSIVAGEFKRGPHRGGTARLVNSFERDRVRALQLMDQATRLVIDADLSPEAKRPYYSALAEFLLANRAWNQAWRLQYLTDLSKLPDYEDGYYAGDNGGFRGAPVDAAGTPVYHAIPRDWNSAKTDGERWRWAVAHADYRYQLVFAEFCLNQFGVQTMQEYGWFFGRAPAEEEEGIRKNESGTYDLHTLTDDETIARLANGIKRFKLLDEFNPMKLFRRLADEKRDDYVRDQALRYLAQAYEDRRQYDRAVPYWRAVGAQDRIDQILKPWGQFEPVMTQPAAGKGASVEFRFRNGTALDVEIDEINVARLLNDVRAYIRGKPKQLDWEQLDIQNFGYRLVEKNQRQYLMGRVAAWKETLKPRPNHWDRRLTLQTPVKKAGAYLVTARLPGGNVSRIIVWVADTAIVRKTLDKAPFYYVADAVSGKPLAGATLTFFGYRMEWVADKLTRGGRHEVFTKDAVATTDADGMYVAPAPDDYRNYQWLITATTPEGRLAYLGFTGVWWGSYHDQEYNESKCFIITDRPVYRPEQTVKFKVWVNHAKYDQEGRSPWAGKQVSVRIHDPKGEKALEKSYTADAYGGISGEFPLPKGATLGVYQLVLPHGPVHGQNQFRVEEYKKPEFEVNVEAPKEPVMLGEKITATITAKYYFGAPVTEGKVKYKVLRTGYSAQWYPVGGWDWFYGPGYWWFSPDYLWYPGWTQWGCRRPMPWWWGEQPQQPPELLMEAEVPVGKDGTVKIDIDTLPAKVIQGDMDHRYEITAEVTDQSRRVIVGQGSVLVARRPFRVYVWLDRGHYRTGDAVEASFKAQTLDSQPVKGQGDLVLYKIGYDRDNTPKEKKVESWRVDTSAEGEARQQLKAAEAGQYRLSYTLKDAKGHTIEGGYLFTVMGEDTEDGEFRFNDIELIADRKEYAPGDKVRLRVNINRKGAAVLLFVRPANGVCLAPKLLRLKGKSTTELIEVTKKDMPNFFVEAVTVANGKVHSEMREIVVPPEQRVINVAVEPTKTKYLPGEKAEVKLRLTDLAGKPYAGSLVLTMYDKSVEYVSGGSNVPEIREFFWKWRRQHHPQTESSLGRGGYNVLKSGEVGMGFLGVFGASLADESGLAGEGTLDEVRDGGAMAPDGGGGGKGRVARMAVADAVAAPAAMMSLSVVGGVMPAAESASMEAKATMTSAAGPGVGAAAAPMVQPTVRTNFADTALWIAALDVDAKGETKVELTMPENLTTWKTKVWAMGEGTRVGEGAVELITTKNLLLRLQAPRFFVQKDEVVLSANVHNYLDKAKRVEAVLELDNREGVLWPTALAKVTGDGRTVPPQTQTVEIPAGGEKRVDWRVSVLQPGQVKVRMKALSDEESDATEMSFPAFVHGMLKTDSACTVLRPDKDSAVLSLTVPAERLPEQSRLEVRYSPTLAAAMVDALPYMVDYPYGCTEQTLNRFVPTVITQRILQRLNLDLKDIEKKRTNLNAQEIGDDKVRATDWKRGNPPNPGMWVRNPVFDVERVKDMVKAGVERLGSMQCRDGGWGWFSGYGEQSWPHTTAVVVHGLQIARENDALVPEAMLNRGVQWLRNYQADQVRRLKLPKTHRDHKGSADDLDAFIYLVLVDARLDDKEMREFLYRDRNGLAVYTKAMFGMACHRVGDLEKRDMLVRNIEQYLVQDDENFTAYLKLPESNCWWYWYGSEYEAHAYYLKLLALVEPKGEKASRLVKYLINNRRHATYWNSTRDTAVVLEAFADYLKASGETEPDMEVSLVLDGKDVKKVKITRDNLFSFDNQLLLEGEALTAGKHTLEIRRQGKGPVYVNAYLTNFTLEDPITKAGLEIKVQRRFFKLERADKSVKVEGAHGQALDQKVEKYERRPLADLAELKSGDLLEVELEIDSKNDYEYILFEDMKAAGSEAVEVRSGYTGNEMGAYVEFRDERVVFFVRALARGKHSVSYRLRAEIPGRFSALPTRASAMYAPELKANSDEFKLRISD